MTAPARLVREGFPPLLPQDRAPGRHLSDVTRSICMGLGDFDDDRDPPFQLMRLGLTLEWGLTHQLTHHYPERYFRTWDERYQYWKTGLQIERDGISGNVDLLNVGGVPPWEPLPATPAVWAVEDIKMTRKSKRHDHDTDSPMAAPTTARISNGGGVMWSSKWREAWMRVAGYCWMVGARVGRLWVAHLFDYNDRFGDVWCPVWERCWDTPEGEEELRVNWEMIVRHERGMAPCEH